MRNSYSNTNLYTDSDETVEDITYDTYLTADGLYKKEISDEETVKNYQARETLKAEDIPFFETASEVFGLLSELFTQGNGKVASKSDCIYYAYSDDMGSGFRASYSLTKNDLYSFYGADIFLGMFDDDATITATITVSVFFDGNDKLKYAETELDLAVEKVEETTDDDGNTKTETVASGSYKYYKKTTVETSSTVQYPADLESYQTEQE
jgi:hypothetical protein